VARGRGNNGFFFRMPGGNKQQHNWGPFSHRKRRWDGRGSSRSRGGGGPLPSFRGQRLFLQKHGGGRGLTTHEVSNGLGTGGELSRGDTIPFKPAGQTRGRRRLGELYAGQGQDRFDFRGKRCPTAAGHLMPAACPIRAVGNTSRAQGRSPPKLQIGARFCPMFDTFPKTFEKTKKKTQRRLTGNQDPGPYVVKKPGKRILFFFPGWETVST